MDDRIVYETTARLREYGFDVAASREPEGFDGSALWDAVLTREGDPSWRWPVDIALLEPLTMESLRRAPWNVKSTPTLLVGAKISARTAEQFRSLGTCFVDVAGNAFIRHDGVLLDVRGRTGQGALEERAVSSRNVNLFSNRRAQVLFVLLTWPGMMSAPRRTIARVAGVSVGLASEVVDSLRASGTDEVDLQPGGAAREQLIDQWSAAFASGLGAEKRARTFAGQTLEVQAVDGVEVFRSGEAATAWLRPETLSLWVRPWSSALALANRWRAGATPNIWVREAFWTDPRPYPSGVRTAPPLLVYAELMAAGDSRSQEAAARVRAETGLVDALG